MATKNTAKKTGPAKKATAKTPAKSPSSASSRSRASGLKDAVALLDADHKAVKKMFQEYEALAESRGRSPTKRRELAQTICQELKVHTQLEEEIFYPAARKAIKDNALLNEAAVEHACAKELIAQIEGGDVGDEMFDAKVKVLGEYIDHHVKEERTEMFAKVRKTKLDLDALGAQMEARKEELKAQPSGSGNGMGQRITAPGSSAPPAPGAGEGTDTFRQPSPSNDGRSFLNASEERP